MNVKEGKTNPDLFRLLLQGDVKKLTNFTPEYRLRVGSYRVLFGIDGQILTIYQVKHRRDAYN